MKKNNSTIKLIEILEKNDTLQNIQLNEFRSKLQQIVNSFKAVEVDPLVSKVKAAYEAQRVKTSPIEITASKEFFILFDEFIEAMESERSTGTLKQYRAVKNNLHTFQDTQKFKIDVNALDIHFYDTFRNYLSTKHKLYANKLDADGKPIKRKEQRVGMNANSVGHNLKTLKTFLNYLVKRKIITPGIDLREDFKIPQYHKTIVYHSQEELEALYNFDFKNERLEHARDVHVFLCNTSLRISDYKGLKAEHFTPRGIRKRTVKTGADIYIPYTPQSRAILEKYNFNLPQITEQRLNDYIKEACQISELYNYPVEIVTQKAGKTIRKSVPKWALISNHTAVKTFITHADERGVPLKVIATITGKAVQTIINNYLGTSDAVIEREMEKAFGISNMKIS